MKTVPNKDEREIVQLREALDEAKEEASRIVEASQSLRDMIDLLSVMFEQYDPEHPEHTGPVDPKILP